MKVMMEELGGCLILIVIGRILFCVMEKFYSLAGAL